MIYPDNAEYMRRYVVYKLLRSGFTPQELGGLPAVAYRDIGDKPRVGYVLEPDRLKGWRKAVNDGDGATLDSLTDSIRNLGDRYDWYVRQRVDGTILIVPRASHVKEIHATWTDVLTSARDKSTIALAWRS